MTDSSKRSTSKPFNLLIVAIALVILTGSAHSATANNLLINTPRTFSSLDGSLDDMDGMANGVLTVDNLSIENGGRIYNDDPASPANNSAGAIKIAVSDSFAMAAGSAVTAENKTSGGSGGDISIVVGNNLYLEGTNGSLPGALISSRKSAGSGDTGRSGAITMSAPVFATGFGSIITAGRTTQTDRGSGGAIRIDGAFITIDGEVSSRSGMSGTGAKQAPGGGTIFIVATFGLSIGDTAVISSRGLDPGADLVHLEGILVFVAGLVESTGPGHSIPNNPANHLGPAYRSDKPATSTGGIEIWGDYVTIDRAISHAELNADIGYTGGTKGRGWIDIYAYDHLEIFGGTSGSAAVHANGGLSQNTDDGGIITVKCALGDVIASGLALQADSTTAGGKGGQITVEANTDLWLDTAAFFARGDFAGGGGYGYGGSIGLTAFNGSLTWTNGIGDVRPTGSAVPAARVGVILLNYFLTVDTTNTAFPANGTATTPAPPVQISGGNPVFPVYVILPHF